MREAGGRGQLRGAREAQAELIEAGKFSEISDNIFVTGEVSGAYHNKYMAEQALVLKTNNGLTVITGCAHPGIMKMVDKVKTHFPHEPLYLVCGGFHLKESDKRAIEIVIEEFKKSGIRKAGPTHCSGEEAEAVFKESYNADFVPIVVGQELEV